MAFRSRFSGMYHKSGRVAAGSTDPSSVTSVVKLLLCLPGWSLLNEGEK